MAESNVLININGYDTKNKLLLRIKQIYHKIVAERKTEINALNNKCEYDKLTYHIKIEDKIAISFKDCNCPLVLMRNLQDGFIDLKRVKENHEKIRSSLSKTIVVKWEHKSEEEKITINNLKIFYNPREKVIKLFDDYTTMLSIGKYDKKHGKSLKILFSKQMLQRLALALAQIKSGNTSENLLNKITQIIYSLYRAKQITKKVCKTIMNSIKL